MILNSKLNLSRFSFDVNEEKLERFVQNNIHDTRVDEEVSFNLKPIIVRQRTLLFINDIDKT